MIKLLSPSHRILCLILIGSPALYGQVQPPITCGNHPACYESNSFVVVISDFRSILQNTNNKSVTIRLGFRNKLNRPLILGYVNGSGVATDDKGNRYVVWGPQAVRGIGEIGNGAVDPKFTLQPAETSEARLEFVWRSSGQEIFGLTFEIDTSIREINPTPSGQYQLGREHAVRFTGLGNQGVPSAAPPPAVTSAAPPAAAQPQAAPAPLPPPVDACAGKPRCYSAGPFVAEVIGMTPSVDRGYHVMRAMIRFRNLTNQPIILAYKTGSAAIADNLGQRYGYPVAQGIGEVAGNHANPQFVLQPGQTGDASFSLKRYMPNTGMGSTYNVDLTIAQLELLQSQQIRTVREYSVSFTDLAVASNVPGVVTPGQSGESVGDAAKKLRDIFKKKK